jgi:hypothetical protein
MDDIKKSIKDLWLTGLTASQISMELCISRGSVMGKIHRMREAGEIGTRESDVRMGRIRAQTKKLERERVLTLFDVMHETPIEKEEAIELIKELPVPTVPSSKPIKFDKLTPKSCRYVLNDGDPANFLFCGKQKNGRSYCKEHEALCYYRIERKGKK